MKPSAGLSLRILRIAFRFVWCVAPLRFAVGRWWPAMHLRVDGHTMLLHPGDNLTERFMWLRGRRYEAASIGRLTLLVAGKRALIVDIGANCGAFTVPLAKAAAAGARIIAFEPNPAMATRLRANLELNDVLDKVELEKVAVGRSESVANLYLGKVNLGASSLLPVESRNTIPVTVRPLKHYLPEQPDGYEIFVIKIDAEGFEDEALIPFLNATSSACMPDAILMETDRSDLWSADPISVLIDRGYVAHFEGEEGNTLFLRATNDIREERRVDT